ncbi:hypothetical protein PMIN03_001218 [Paraphaeosphaeria minitans]
MNSTINEDIYYELCVHTHSRLPYFQPQASAFTYVAKFAYQDPTRRELRQAVISRCTGITWFSNQVCLFLSKSTPVFASLALRVHFSGFCKKGLRGVLVL